MKNRTFKIFSAVCAAFMMTAAISGCQLAKPYAAAVDKFVGMFVTIDKEHEQSALTGDTNGRIYAAYNLSDYTHGSFSADDFFPGLNGVLICGPEFGEGDGAYITSIVSSGGSDAYMNAASTDDSSDISLTANIYYAAAASGGAMLTAYNVLLQTDGCLYIDLNSADASYISGPGDISISHAFDTSSDISGKTKKERLFVEAVVKPTEEPLSYLVLEFDSDNNLIADSVFSPDNVPDALTPGADAEFIIIEQRSGTGELREISRSVYSRNSTEENKRAEIISAGPFESILSKKDVELIWQ